MPKLTSKQAFDLADEFHELSKSVSDYAFENVTTLSKAQFRDLDDKAWNLRNAASDFVTTGVKLSLDEVDAHYDELIGATKQARKAVKKIEKVKEVIEVATAGVNLASAIVAGDMKAIAKAAKSLYDEARDITG